MSKVFCQHRRTSANKSTLQARAGSRPAEAGWTRDSRERQRSCETSTFLKKDYVVCHTATHLLNKGFRRTAPTTAAPSNQICSVDLNVKNGKAKNFVLERTQQGSEHNSCSHICLWLPRDSPKVPKSVEPRRANLTPAPWPMTPSILIRLRQPEK